MNQRNNKDQYDNTNDMFLKFIKKTHEKKVKEEKIKTKANVDTLSKFTGVYNYINYVVDRTLNNNGAIVFISIVLTFMLFFAISGDENVTSPTSGTKISDVSVQIENLDYQYEVFGVPESITVGVIGPSLDIYKTNLSKDYEIYLDLSSINEVGTYTLDLQYRNFEKTLDVMLLPNTVNVHVEEKVETKMSLGHIFINEDKLDSKYSVSLESMTLEEVQIYASETTLSKIDKVVACIDVSNQTQSFTQSALIKAYDINGEILDVDISPQSVDVSCGVASYSKTVSIEPRYNGAVETGYGITGCTLDNYTVTVYGLEENLEAIDVVYADINIDGLKTDTLISNVSLKKEKGINKLSIETVEASVTVEQLITKTIEDVVITVLNNTNDYKVSFAGEGKTATLQVTGTQSKVEALTASNVQATVDINNLDVGSHKVKVNLASDDEYLKLELLSSDMITINIERK